MNYYLKSTSLEQFVHHLHNGEQVVRNPKINALIETKLTDVAPEFRRILATPQFKGTLNKEQIDWYTDQFVTEPKSLQSLRGESREHYLGLLDRIMEQYASAATKVPESIRNLFHQAITYHSLDNVFCADDKIVLTEWGMHLQNNGKWVDLIGVNYQTTNISDKNPGANAETDNDKNTNNGIASLSPASSTVNPPLTDTNDRDKVNGESIIQPEPESPTPGNPGIKPQNVSGGGTTPPPPPTNNGSNRGSSNKRFNWKKWLLWLLALLLLLLLLFQCSRSCNRDKDPLADIPKVAPVIDPEKDISISDDSLTMEVNNRIILLIKRGGSVSQFVRDFREVYPDEDKYLLANPDTILPRVILVLPAGEKKEFMETLPDKFPQWDLSVIPETLFKNSSVSVNDPDMRDATKRWYFEMCSIFDAWSVTMGDPNVTVAVIDGDFDLSHPEIQGKIVKPYNAVYHDTDLYIAGKGHGMHVAATAVGNADNNEGIAGIAPHCKLMPIQVDDRNGLITTSALIDGILYAIMQNADVVNLSLGMEFNNLVQFLPIGIQKNIIANNFLEEERFFNELFELGEENNVTFVIAGGNDNILIGIDPMSRCQKTIRVSAVQPDRYKASFSNFGSYSTLSAPGVQIYNALPDNKYAFMNGTSMAAPIVTGAVALLKSIDKSFTTRDIIQHLQVTGIPSLSDVGPIVNFANALGVPDDTVDKPGNNPSHGSYPGYGKYPYDGTNPIAGKLPGGGIPPGSGTSPDFGDGAGGTDTDCSKYQKRYYELLEELERLKREHPDCIAEPDTLTIPVDATVDDISGLWKSTTKLYNTDEVEVVIYFAFNGTPQGTIIYVEPDGTRFTAPITIDVKNDKVYIEQQGNATGKGGAYLPYNFVLKPDKNRHAEGSGYNVAQPSHKVNFNLIRLNS